MFAHFEISAVTLLAALGPALLLGAGFVPVQVADRMGRRFAASLSWLSAGVFLMAVAAACVLSVGGEGPSEIAAGGGWRLPLMVDALSVSLLVLVSFLSAIVLRYSRNYLGGDPHQGRFVRLLALTSGSVMVMVLSGNLLGFALAWLGTSLFLHRLLTFYPERRNAIAAAQKKFLVSRIGDACMVAALVLAWRGLGTWDFAGMFSRVEAFRASGAMPWEVGALAVALGAGALLKSAQFPFHVWLPETMETPTPVSALMHAGIINAGGFLVLRLSPIVSLSCGALNALALVGAFTALYGSLVMLTQTSVKRSLAYSTVAQMGFMMLECGLGAFALAALHLLAHSLYKAHAFLSSGSVVSLSRSAWVPVGRPAAHPMVLAGVLVSAVGLTGAAAWAAGIDFKGNPGLFLLSSVQVMAIVHLLWNLWSSSYRTELFGWGLGAGALSVASYFALHSATEHLLAGCLPHFAPERHPLEFVVMGGVGLLFLGMLVFQEQLPSWSRFGWVRALYVHASRGFYLRHLVARILCKTAGNAA